MNQTAQQPQQIQALKLRDTGYVVIGGGLTVDIDPVTGDLVVGVAIEGGRVSSIVGLTPVRVSVMELRRIPEAEVIRMFGDTELRAGFDRIGVQAGIT